MINLYDLQGNKLDLEGYKGLKLHIPSPSFDVESEKIDGRNGEIFIDKTLQPRNLTADFYMKSKDYTDSLLLRDVIYRQINGREFYIAESHLPHKRWRVHLSGDYEMDRLAPTMQTFSVSLICMSGLAESVGTTKDALTFTADVWQSGQGLEMLDTADMPIYTHSTNIFRVYNAGDVAIDPRDMPLKIKYKGASDGLQIINDTTMDSFKFNGTTTTGDTLTLDGIRTLKNGISVFKNTNKVLISLAPGWNYFTLIGADPGYTIEFDYRFYYY